MKKPGGGKEGDDSGEGFTLKQVKRRKQEPAESGPSEEDAGSGGRLRLIAPSNVRWDAERRHTGTTARMAMRVQRPAW